MDIGLPLPDLGLVCRRCRYPLAGVARWACPECGLEIDLDSYLPEGAWPMLIIGGQVARATPDRVALLRRYKIGIVEQRNSVGDMLGGYLGPVLTDHAPVLCVPRDRYFEAIDLIRRFDHDEPMPPPPPDDPHADADWACPECGEENPPNFDLCWSCSAPRPEA